MFWQQIHLILRLLLSFKAALIIYSDQNRLYSYAFCLEDQKRLGNGKDFIVDG